MSLFSSEESERRSFSDVIKENRLSRIATDLEDQTLSQSVYNAIIGGVVLYGIIINYLICKYFDMSEMTNPIPLFIFYFIFCIAGTLIVNYSHNPLLSFLGYNMIVVPMGFVISVAVNIYAEIDPSIVTSAVFYTGVVTILVVLAAVIFPQFFSRLGSALLVGLTVALIFSLFSFIIKLSFLTYIFALIFALYIGYDFYRSQQYSYTIDNAIDSATDIYVDIMNLFIRLLSIIARAKSKD